MKPHAPQCTGSDEACNCGATRPATLEWAHAEVLAARHAVLVATRQLKTAEHRLAVLRGQAARRTFLQNSRSEPF
jgi:outer membrane protein TolC